jgi:sulfate transport system permease protein
MDTTATKRNARSILPGFGLTMGFTTLYVSLIVVIPLAGLFFRSATLTWAAILHSATDHDVIASLKVTFGLSFIAACLNVFFGFITAWTLVRYRFPLSKFFDAVIDLPFALPTAVSGITLATLLSHNGWLGPSWKWFSDHGNSLLALFHLPQFLPEQVAYSLLGMQVAYVFIGMPFVVRTLQPALEDLDPEVEEAASSLGASRRQTFWRVVIPALLPAVLTGFSLSFARSIGEYGSIVFISPNIPGESQITPLLIMKKLENNDYAGATLLGLIMLVISFVILIAVNGLQWWTSAKSKGEAA